VPSGKTHDKLTVITAVAAVPVWWFASPVKDWVGMVVGLTAYLFSGFWLSDDLDTNSLSYKRWGAFRFLWWPYQKLVPHRSWVSHSIGFGPIFRVAYFLVMLWALMRVVLWMLIEAHVPVDRDAVLGGFWGFTTDWTAAHPSWAMCALLGLVLGGVTHSVADAVVSWAKRVW
jgi:uncharacterized metal-binding protein